MAVPIVSHNIVLHSLPSYVLSIVNPSRIVTKIRTTTCDLRLATKTVSVSRTSEVPSVVHTQDYYASFLPHDSCANAVHWVVQKSKPPTFITSRLRLYELRDLCNLSFNVENFKFHVNISRGSATTRWRCGVIIILLHIVQVRENINSAYNENKQTNKSNNKDEQHRNCRALSGVFWYSSIQYVTTYTEIWKEIFMTIYTYLLAYYDWLTILFLYKC